jgi:Flp pilus assembly protein TadG
MIDRMGSLSKACDGAVMIEFSLIALLLLIVTCGMVDFSLALYQWNGASKAVELGGRLAATSDPVSSNISSLSPASAFSQVCSGASSSCSGGGVYSSAAMNTIVYGRGKSACGAVASGQLAAMCDVYPGLTASNVTVIYQQSAYATSGLGFAGRSDGPVPTITVEVTGLTFNFFFLNGLLGLAPMSMPTMRTTVTGEDLSSSGS